MSAIFNFELPSMTVTNRAAKSPSLFHKIVVTYCTTDKPLHKLVSSVYIFNVLRSTPPSRPNNIGGGNVRPSLGTYVRPSVRPSTKSFFSDFNEIWCVDRGR